MKIRQLPRFFLSVFLLLSAFQLIGQSDFKPVTGNTLNQYKAQIKAKNSKITSISCPFTQTKNMSILKNPTISKGIMYFKKNEKFRWEYVNNPTFIFAQNGKTIYTKSGDKVQIIKDNSVILYQQISKLVMQSINGEILENNKEFTTKFEENGSFIKIILEPKQRNMKKFIASIQLLVDKKSYLASQFTLNEPNGDNTIIKFENVKMNQNIDDSMFILK